MTPEKWHCRLCGRRLIYLRRTFTFHHIVPVFDHAPKPERAPSEPESREAWGR